MRSIVKFLAVFFFSFYSCWASAEVLTLRDAILIALRYNSAITNAEIQRVIDKLNLKIAIHTYEINYAFTGTAGYTNSTSSGFKSEGSGVNLMPGATLLTPTGAQIAVNMSHPLTQTTGASVHYNPSVNFSVSQPLLRGFGPAVALAPLHNAEDQEILNQFNLKNTAMSQVTTVINQYAGLVQAQNSLEAQVLSLKDAEANLRRAEALLKVGRSSPADLVQFQSAVSTQQLSIEQQKLAVEQARFSFFLAIGIDPENRMIVPRQFALPETKLPTLTDIIALTLKNNITYQQQLISIRQLKRQLLVANDQQQWQLNLTASRTQGGGGGGGANGGWESLTNGANTNTQVGLALSVPIDDYQRQRLLATARVQLTQAFANLRILKQQTITNVTSSYHSLISQKLQIQQAADALRLAEQNLSNSIAKLKYDKTTAFEVSTLQVAVLTARLSYINTIVNYANTQASFDQIIGKTLDRWKIGIQY